MEHCLRQMRSTRIVTFSCTASTTPQDILQKLLQVDVKRIFMAVVILRGEIHETMTFP